MNSIVAFIALPALVLAGCDEVGELDEADGAVDTDSDTDNDTDSDCGPGDCGPPWGWYDKTSGLCWQDPPHDEPLAWEEAIEYCDALVLCDHDDWRLPSISELRSFIRGCEAIMTGGECGVTDECTSFSCRSQVCDGCTPCGGPGPVCYDEEDGWGGGYYCDGDVVGGELYSEMDRLWSSTPSSFEYYIWFVNLKQGRIYDLEHYVSARIICVRDGLQP